MYILTRKRDSLTKISKDICYIEWDEKGFFKKKYNTPAIGRSLLMSPINEFYTWQTTPITEIIENENNILFFKTKNSTYILIKKE